MEWIISSGITLLIVFIGICYHIDIHNYNYWFEEFSVKEKIAHVVVNAVTTGCCIGLFVVITWLIKEIIF